MIIIAYGRKRAHFNEFQDWNEGLGWDGRALSLSLSMKEGVVKLEWKAMRSLYATDRYEERWTDGAMGLEMAGRWRVVWDWSGLDWFPARLFCCYACF